MLVLFPKISRVAMSGKMGSGKSTISKKLCDLYGYKMISISSSIIKTATLLIENPNEQLKYLSKMLGTDSHVKAAHEELVCIFNEKFQNNSVHWEKDSSGNYIKNQSYRDLTQTVATKTREYFGEDIFVKFTTKEADDLTSKGYKIICDDLRLPEEKNLLEKAGFSIVRIEVEKEEQYRRLLSMYGKINEEQLSHITETALDNEKFDFKFDTTLNSIEVSTTEVARFLSA